MVLKASHDVMHELRPRFASDMLTYLFQTEHVLQLGLDRIELPETAKQPVSRKRTKSEADSPASSAQNVPSPVGGPPGPQVGLCPIQANTLSRRAALALHTAAGANCNRPALWCALPSIGAGSSSRARAVLL